MQFFMHKKVQYRINSAALSLHNAKYRKKTTRLQPCIPGQSSIPPILIVFMAQVTLAQRILTVRHDHLEVFPLMNLWD